MAIDLRAPPITLSIGLALTPPTGADPGIEVAGGGYQRMLATFDRPGDAPDDQTLASTGRSFEWPRATGFWGDIGWLTGWDLDGQYVAFGNVVDPDDEFAPVIVRIDRGDVARVKAGDLVLRPSGAAPPRPYSVGQYGRGPYSRYPALPKLNGTITGSFLPAASPCPGASNWIMEPLP